MPLVTWFYRTNNGQRVSCMQLIDSKSKLSITSNTIFSVSNRTSCQKRICELHLSNYTRYDPKIIECVADNKKSIRISKVFHIDVLCKKLRNHFSFIQSKSL